ncbi:hypothetical protein TYRP_019273, partial [Tyrophagus putrescentiae]
LNLNADYVFLRRGEKWPKIGGLLPARPVLAQSAPPSSASAHKNRHPPPPSYLAFCEYRNPSKKHYYYYPGVLVENELAQNGTLAFYYGLYTVHGSQVCDGVYVMAVLNTRPPPPPIDYRRRFNKLFYLLYTTLLFATYHLIFCEDWTHSGENSEEEEEDGNSKERQNFQIGISLPWVKTSRRHLSTIPKSLLVQINIDLHNDDFIGTPFFCRVEVVKKMKIIGKLDYDKQQCIIPGKFPLSPIEQIQTVTDKNGLMDIPTSGEWPIFEVLLNPRRLNLNADYVYLRREKNDNKFGGLLPARPVRAQSAPSPTAHRKRHPPSSYLAFCRYQDTSPTPDQYYYYPGVVVEDELVQNGTLASTTD